MTRKEIHIIKIICDACGKEIKNQRWKHKLDIKKNDEDFLLLKDLHTNCYNDTWIAIRNVLKKLRGKKNVEYE